MTSATGMSALNNNSAARDERTMRHPASGRQRGFTLLEMMLVVLLAGIAASLVAMAFPADRKSDGDWQLARFQAQLDFAAETSQMNETVLGVRILPDGWQFLQLQRQTESASVGDAGRWQGFGWRPWQPYRVMPAGVLPDTVRLELLPAGGKHAAQTPAQDTGEPSILILPGGEITPFRLLFVTGGRAASSWLEVDASGVVRTSLLQGEKP
ncbi:type II secretion system minor pseudopilin GspH [Brenneria sp. L3_3C_1]|nr:type II secretion system minor pseudopilin GspH [Brenneria sp. L3-3C-1]MEE3642703.1 type II secretion system minor pseudopilin GspH [Brenneria sp. L3_3C_1]